MDASNQHQKFCNLHGSSTLPCMEGVITLDARWAAVPSLHHQERRSSFIAVHRGCLHISCTECITSAGDIQTNHSAWPIASRCTGIWIISPRWLPDIKENDKISKTYITKTYCKCKNGKCGNKCPCHRAELECNIGCLCSGDPLRCSHFTIEWRAFCCLNVPPRLV